MTFRIAVSAAFLVLVSCGVPVSEHQKTTATNETSESTMRGVPRVVPPDVVGAGRDSVRSLPTGAQVTTTTFDRAGFIAWSEDAGKFWVAIAQAVASKNAEVAQSGESSGIARGGSSVLGDGSPESVRARPSATSYPTAAVPPDLVEFARCVIGHESATAGVYGAVSSNGVWRGAYQMDDQFWRSYAPVEWKHLAGRHETAPADVQDLTMVAGYRARGGQPWTGSGC